MARTAQSKEIKGADDVTVTYTVHMMPPLDALDLFQDLVKVIGPGLAPIFNNLGTIVALLDQEVEGMRTDFLGEAIKTLSSGVDKKVTREVIKKLAEHTSIAGETGSVSLAKVLDAHFGNAGLAAMMFDWLPFALQVQYGDFLGRVASAMKSGASLAKTMQAPH